MLNLVVKEDIQIVCRIRLERMRVLFPHVVVCSAKRGPSHAVGIPTTDYILEKDQAPPANQHSPSDTREDSFVSGPQDRCTLDI